MTDTTKAYFDHLITTGRPTAAESYGYSLNGFRKWLASRGKDDIDSFTYNEAEEYMRTGFGAPRTANNFKIALMGYLKHKSSSMPCDAPDYDVISRKIDQLRRLKNLKIPRVYGKSSLEPEEVKQFLTTLKVSGAPQLVYSLAVMTAFFGTRPIELEKNLRNPKTVINLEDHSMLILGAKTGQLRFLTWPRALDDHMKIIYENCPCPYPGEFLTKHLKYRLKGKSITAKTLRRTLQTQNRVNGVADIVTDAILGHESSGHAMAGVYTDYSSPSFISKIREAMTTDLHYMIQHHLIPEL